MFFYLVTISLCKSQQVKICNDNSYFNLNLVWFSLFKSHYILWGFPGGTSGKEPTCQCRRHEIQVPSLSWEGPLEGHMQPTPVFLPEESHGQESLVSYSPQCHKESDTTEVTEHPVKLFLKNKNIFEKENKPYVCISMGKIPWRRAWKSITVFLTWRILGTEECGGLQSVEVTESDTMEATQQVYLCLSTRLKK